MTVLFDGKPQTVPDGETFAGAVARLSPFGEDPVLATCNGERLSPDDPRPLCEGDAICVYPLLIGG